MCCSANGIDRTDGAALCLFGSMSFFAVAGITLLVVGILGSHGVIPMTSSGAEWMAGIGAAIIVGMISGVLKVCCK